MIVQLLILALALSIDALGIGISYGIRKINFKISSLFIISFMALCFSSVSILFGSFISSIISPKVTSFLSVCILVFLGLFIIKKGVTEHTENIDNENKKTFLQSLNLTLDVIKKPSLCDLNNSFKIEPKEAFYLGMALSLDCICTSVAISSFKAHTFLFPIFVVVFQLSFLLIGLFLGKSTNFKKLDDKKISICSGLMLVVIGFLRIVLYK